MSLLRGDGARKDATELARAKVNLTLHVGRVIRDADRFHGYHPLDSLVVFADVGDVVTVEPDERYALTVTGPFGAGLEADETNLVTRAVRAAERLGADGHLAVTLDKRLPVASGLGGGSADAAAVLRALVREDVSEDELMREALGIGADVPVCLRSTTQRMTGIGDTLTPVPGAGSVAAMLANPGVGVSTAEVFRRFDARDDVRDTPRPQLASGDLLARARNGRNDLEPVAVAMVPAIGELIAAMDGFDGCELARMSGSGASVFGLFATDAQARAAADALCARGVWAMACHLGDA